MTTPSTHAPDPDLKRLVGKLPRPHRDLLALGAFLQPEAIPYAVLRKGAEHLSAALNPICSKPDQLRAFLAEMAKLGLLETRKRVFNVRPEAIRVIADTLDSEARLAWANAAHQALEAAYRSAKTAHEVGLLVPHIRALGTHAERAGLPLFPVSTLIYSAGLFLHEGGRSAEAIPMIRHSVDLCLMLDDENHPLIATRLNTLGLACHAAGHLNSARECFERALRICEHVFGPTEKAVYTSADERFLTHPMRNLCRVLLEMNEPDAMQEAFDRALDTYLQVHGPYHPLVAECANDMGRIWHESGNLDRAALHFEKAVEAETNANEPVPGNLAAYLVNLGAVRIQQELLDEAEKLYDRALKLDTLDHGASSPEVGRDLIGIGQVHQLKGQHEEAALALEKAQAIVEADPAPNQSELRLLAASLGRIAVAERKFDVAETHQRRALEIAKAIFGLDAGETAHDHFTLARTLMLRDGPVEASEHLRHALYIETSLHGDTTEHVAAIHRSLGEAHEALEDGEAARVQYDKALAIDRELFGDDHPNTARDLYRIGVYLTRNGETVSGIATLNRALAICEEHFGRDHSRTRRIRRRLAELSS